MFLHGPSGMCQQAFLMLMSEDLRLAGFTVIPII